MKRPHVLSLKAERASIFALENLLLEDLINRRYDIIYLFVLCRHRELYLLVSIRIAKNLQCEMLWLVYRVLSVMEIGALVHKPKLIVPSLLPSYLEPHRLNRLTQSKAELPPVPQVLPPHLEVGSDFARLNFVCPHYYAASALLLSLQSQLGFECLGFGAHDVPESCFHRTNGIELSGTVPVYHLEFEPLFLFEEEIDNESRFKVGVEVVFDLLRLAQPDPLV